MIKTNKYQKAVEKITRMAAELNPDIGTYKAHYINKDAGFTIQLSNGKIEIPVDLTCAYIKNNESLDARKIRKIALTYNEGYSRKKLLAQIDADWKNLFADPIENTNP